MNAVVITLTLLYLLCDWPKEFTPLPQLIRKKIKTNRDPNLCVFLRESISDRKNMDENNQNIQIYLLPFKYSNKKVPCRLLKIHYFSNSHLKANQKSEISGEEFLLDYKACYTHANKENFC